MGKCKTELDIKLNEHLINAAREIKSHCKGMKYCVDCIFCRTTSTDYVFCRLNDDPCTWEVDSDEL